MSELTRKDALERIDAIMADPEGPYLAPDHPNHMRAVQIMTDLHEFAYGDSGDSKLATSVVGDVAGKSVPHRVWQYAPNRTYEDKLSRDGTPPRSSGNGANWPWGYLPHQVRKRPRQAHPSDYGLAQPSASTVNGKRREDFLRLGWSDPDGPPWAAQVQGPAARRRSIMNDTPALISVQPDPTVDDREPEYFIEAFEEVSENDSIIQRAAVRHGVDPDLVRAIIYVETTQGYYDRAAAAWDGLTYKDVSGPTGQNRRHGVQVHKQTRKHNTIRPMNVHAELWSKFGVSRADLDDPEKNIDAGVRILRGLIERMPGATVAQISTAYNQLGAERVNDYGSRVSRVYAEKPWRTKE